MNLIERVAATQKTVDTFKGKQFVDWQVDCIALLRCHVRNMHHRLKVPKYTDRESAVAALKSLGVTTLAEALDADPIFERINQHDVLASDVVECPGGNGFSGLSIAVGNGRVLGFHDDIPHCDILQPVLISGVWRIV